MDQQQPAQAKRFAFISSNTHWGGSEELWSATAAVLAADGHQVTALKATLDPAEPRVRRLRELGCRLVDLKSFAGWPERLPPRMHRASHRAGVLLGRLRLRPGLRRADPALAVISQGGNLDGHFHARTCRRQGIPYVLIAQKASELYWPVDARIGHLRRAYQGAERCYFVAEDNLRLTELQLGISLPHASVVRNPFLVPFDAEQPWPRDADGLRLACVGRLFPREKGQDLLLRVLARPRWRERALSVTFLGEGPGRAALEASARFLGLERVSFAGFTRDVAAIWRDHHGLILPSRAEGLPLVLVEAMLSGRVPIVTRLAGNPEVVEDDRTGFLAAAPSVDAVDEALERAWERRAEWPAIGRAAAAHVRTRVPPDPARVLADHLLQVASEVESRRR